MPLSFQDPLSFHDIAAARGRIAGGLYESPCPYSRSLSALCGMCLWCKLDSLQQTGSFKERGARNALLLLDPDQRRKGVVAASAGNHALGLAYHGMLLGIAVTVVMPRFAPLVKAANCRALGANVLLHGDAYPQALEHARQLAATDGLTFIHGFDDPAIVAGQGTMGLEIVEQVDELDAVVVPVGGAGLIAGLSLAIKSLYPAVQIIGVEAEHTGAFAAALAAGHPVDVPPRPTLADGLAVGRVGELPFQIARQHVDRVVSVNEHAIAAAIMRLMELERIVVEGAAATPLAACLSDQLADLRGRRVALVLCGGNIDMTALSRVIEHGLVAQGRLFRFAALISDRPGGLARLASEIAAAGASIHEIAHDRAFSGPDLTAVTVLCTVETTDAEHIARLRERLTSAGFQLEPR